VIFHPAVLQVLLVANEIEARGVMRGIGRLILFVIPIFVVLAVLGGLLLSRVFRRRRRP